jgi:hypothetical protein
MIKRGANDTCRPKSGSQQMPIERISQGGCFECQIEATQTIWEGADLIDDFQHQIAKLSSHHLQQNNPRMVKQLMRPCRSSISASRPASPRIIPPFSSQPERECLASWTLREKGDVGSWVLNFSSHQPVKPRST